MVYNSLTEAPHNLKEGIDWLLALGGTDAEKNLAAMADALHKFLSDKPVGKMELTALEKVKRLSKDFLGQKELRRHPFVKELLRRFDEPMNKTDAMELNHLYSVNRSDYVNVVEAEGIEPEDIARSIGEVLHATKNLLDDIKNPDQYKSAYSSDATWDASCSEDPEACAVVLVGIAPMLEAGLRSLRYVSRAAGGYLSNNNKKQRLEKLMKALGYDEPECRPDVSATSIFKASKNVSFRMLGTLYDLAGFWAFY
ncbi:hypothetical protein, conserved [Babesia ovata]|uniref:Uncharacterized protein n=1 Tax=Babesia ovata TaxID=189622 RepID=A0A2H6K782_9APIC|nr:uncharacterized protein BOVATA_003460 [Babesia ovata]GBE58853.1 hypothetical protein, conserved [Babesia ovata]